ncbi:MAG: restriction endonuclease subunit S [Bryobacterales bacterium]|nr:restriction endonuclease subunit S [Bryobacterales bacterium]
MKSGSEARWTIPSSWAWTSIGELGHLVGGGTPSTKDAAYWKDEIPWICPADLTGHSAKTIKRGARGISRLGLADSSARVMPAGTVHFSSRAPVGYVVISTESLATNQGFKSLVPAPGVFNEYVYYYLRASRTLARERASGTTFLELSKRSFGALPIPLAPEREQFRIVAKVEELFSELDKFVESLRTARAQLAAYRQSVLKHSFEGKLTAQWRDENRDKLETSEQLLARIKRERVACYAQQLEEWRAGVKAWEENRKLGKRPQFPRKLDDLSRPSSAETETLAPVARGWVYMRLGLVIDEPKYGTSKKCEYNQTGAGVLRIPNVVRGLVDASDLKTAHFAKDEKRKYSLRSGDVLMIRSNGSISIVGKCALVSKADEQYLFAGYLIRLRPNPEVLLPDYLAAVLSSHLLRTQIERAAKSTSGVNNINSGEIQSLLVPVCGLHEQAALVEQLSAYLSAVDVMETEINKELLRAESLRQAIFKRAFSGQLVPQDPNDEPASVLLDRIRAERQRSGKGRRRARAVA